MSLAWSDPLVGDQWGPFQLEDSHGQIHLWKPGRVTVIAFCAYWCSTWKQQIPRLIDAKNETKGLPIDFISISVDGRWAEVAKKSQGLPLWLDPGGEWSHQRGVNRVPTTVVLDDSGEIRWEAGGVVRTKDIMNGIHLASQPIHSGKTIYLTFDDFPAENDNSNYNLLDVLRKYGVPATFFCICNRLEKNRDLIRDAASAGDSLECHSWSHNASDPQLSKCERAFLDVLGSRPEYYRPPGSEKIFALGNQSLKLVSHYPVVDPYDFARPSESELLRRILSGARDGAVIQLHAGVSVTLKALPEIIRSLQKQGFQFKAFSHFNSEILGTKILSLILNKSSR